MAGVEQDGAFVFAGIGGEGGFAGFDLADVLEDVGPVLGALGGILGGHFGEQPAVGDGEIGEEVAGVGEEVQLLGIEDFLERAAFEGRVAGEHVVEGEAEGIDVGAAIGFEALDLLGGDIGGGAFDVFGGLARGSRAGDAGEAQVGELDRAIGAEEDVAGLDVAVDQRGFAPDDVEGAGNDFDQLEGLAMGHALVFGEPSGEIGAGDIFHDIVEGAFVLAEVEDADDGGVRELGGGAGFALELGAGLFVGQQFWGEDLDGDHAVEGQLPGEPHGGGAARAQAVFELVAGQGWPGGWGGLKFHGPRFWTKRRGKGTVKLYPGGAGGRAGANGGRAAATVKKTFFLGFGLD
jgi:hypothetical protein